jgi:inner membrane protein
VWNDGELAFEPGAGPSEPGQAGIHAPLGGRLDGTRFDFDFELVLDGSGSFALAPVGDRSDIELASSWTKPSFRGSWLPTERGVDDDGFTAHWDLGSLGRGYPGFWTSEEETRGLVDAGLIEVELLAPIDHYRMSERSVKYELLFLVLVFTTVWLFEVRSRMRVHPIQYLLVGFALCTFYLLELALSEHIGFAAAYATAAAMVVGMLGMYGASVLGAGWRGAALAGTSGALYGYLYVVLMNEDYALLAGALAVFGALGTVMALTRRIDWYATTSVLPSTGRQPHRHDGGPPRA